MDYNYVNFNDPNPQVLEDSSDEEQQPAPRTGVGSGPYQQSPPSTGFGPSEYPLPPLPLPLPLSTGFGAAQYQQPAPSIGPSQSHPAINVYGATPVSSPQATYATPLLATRNQPTYQPTPTTVSFPPFVACPPTLPATYTARMMLDHQPFMPVFTGSANVYTSSAANEHYGLMAPLKDWPLPTGLGGYDDLSNADLYTPFPTNPLAATVTEADIISATMNAIFNPVETVLSRNSYGYQITAACEDSHTVSVPTALGGSVNHFSRIDRSWSYWDPRAGRSVPFAVMEFKKPGALVEREWRTACMTGGEVHGKGETLCRQLKKYGYGLRTPFVGACDGRILLLLFLGGTRDQWFSEALLQAPTTPALIRWINDTAEMKRNAYVFLREALQWKLQEGRF